MRRLLLIVGFLSTLVCPGYTFNLDSLLIQSVGGPTALEKLRSASTIYSSGTTILNGMAGRMKTYTVVPNRLCVELALGPISMVQAFDGVIAWQRDFNGQISELSGSQKNAILGQTYFQTYSYLFSDRLSGGKEYLGIEERRGVACHKVAFYPMFVDTVYTYFDIASGRQLYDVTSMDNLALETEYSNHRLIDGVLTAGWSHSFAADAQLDMTVSLDTLILNVPVDESRFVPLLSAVDYRFPAGADSVLIPCQLQAGHVYVNATVNGKLLCFLLDSGASSNLLNQPVIAGMNLPVVGSLPAVGMAGFDNVELVRTDSLTIGGLVLLRQVGGVLDLSGLGVGDRDGNLPFGGLLGYDFLSRFPILIDYSAGSLTVYDPDGFVPVPGGHEVPFELTMQVPTIDAKLNGLTGRFLVDLGNPMGLIVHSEFSRKNDLLSSLENITDQHSGIAGVGGGIAGKTALAASFTFGDIQISDIQVLLPDSGGALTGSVELAGNIGNELLRQFRVLFDYRSQLLIFYGADQSGK
jgi:hypothetical protein